jgi:putative FmdB family regulatory protein
MPLFDYRCTACRHEFEALVRGGVTPPCPACGSAALEKLPSLFAVDSDSTRTTARAKSMPKAVGTHREKERGEIEDFHRNH